MTSEWDESRVRRKDFRRSKSDPEIPTKRKRQFKAKKNFKVVIKDHVWGFNQEPQDWIVGKYEKLEAAQQACKSYKNKSHYSTFEIVIEEL